MQKLLEFELHCLLSVNGTLWEVFGSTSDVGRKVLLLMVRSLEVSEFNYMNVSGTCDVHVHTTNIPSYAVPRAHVVGWCVKVASQ